MGKKFLMFLSSPSIQFLSRVVLGGIFVYASIDKILYKSKFAEIISGYHILPDFLINLTATVLPYVELISGLMLILGFLKKFFAAILSLLLIIFIMAIMLASIQGFNFDCGCFSVNTSVKHSNPMIIIARDILMLILGFIILFLKKPINNAISASTFPLCSLKLKNRMVG